MIITLSLQVYAAVSQLVESPLCAEALNVLEAVLQSCSSPGSFQLEIISPVLPQENGGTISVPPTYRRIDEVAASPQRLASVLVSQSSFKLRSSSGPLQQSWAGSSGNTPTTASNFAASDILPSRSALSLVHSCRVAGRLTFDGSIVQPTVHHT